MRLVEAPLPLLLCCACATAPTPPTTPIPTAQVAVEAPAEAYEVIASPDFLEQFAETRGFRLGQPAHIVVTPDEDAVLFLRSGPRSFVRSLYSFDTATGEERELLTAEGILGGAEEEVSDEERARRERLRLSARGITSFELSSDGRHILVPLSGRLYLVTRADGAVVELPGEGGYANDPHLSPDAEKVACVREGDLYVIDIARRTQRRITRTATEHVHNGLPEFVAQEEMRRFRGYWWSPDSRSILYQQTDTSGVETLHSQDPMHPEQPPAAAAYPRAGTANAEVKLGVVSATGGSTEWIDWDRERFPYVATVRWSAGAPPLLRVQDRRQQVEQVLTVDVRTGATTLLFEERDDAWLNLDPQMPRWLPGAEELLWVTERGGAPQLEVRSRQGELVRAVTALDAGYDALEHVDGDAGFVWFRGGAEPTETHVFRAPLAGGPAERITETPGLHEATFGRGHALWVHRSESMTGRPRYAVRRGQDEIGELRSVAEEPPFEPRVEIVTVGERSLRAQVVRPRNFVPGRRYPVLVSVYGGPHALVVQHDQRRNLMRQWYADHGYLVVSVDGRGTPRRGRAFERAIRGNFIEAALEDQVAGLRALGERFPELDLDRVGIYGWSFGGYFAAMAVMREPDVFHAAVAGAPVADWRDYDTHYTERYMGLPADNEDGYRDSSVLTHAPRLRRPLLVVHGTADDNVYFTHAVKLSDALLRAGRDHEFLPLSGFTHMVADPDMTRALETHVVRFFDRHL